VALTRLLPIEPATYAASSLHGEDRMWLETNCYVDVWIELLHALDLDPVAALSFTFSTDFDGDQWRFFKYPASDLRGLYGIEVFEMNPWRGVEHHVEEQLAAGRFMTIEVDSWFLPDTAGTSYRHGHVKTTISPNMIDPDEQRLGYFHNTGYHELTGEDYAGVFRHHLRDQPEVLVPYVELVRLERLRRPTPDQQLDLARGQLRSHLARRPGENPVRAMRKRVETDIEWLKGGDIELFHDYAFASLRQCGANTELAATLCTWLADRGEPVAAAAEQLTELSATVKTTQFKLARAVAGRSTDLTPLFDQMAERYDGAIDVLTAAYGG